MYDSEDATQLNELSIIDEDDHSDETDMEEAVAWRYGFCLVYWFFAFIAPFSYSF